MATPAVASSMAEWLNALKRDVGAMSRLTYPRIRAIAQWMPEDTSRLVRAQVLPTGKVKLTAMDTLSLHTPLPDVYTMGDSPSWVSNRIAVLRMLPVPPPPQPVDEIGLRASETVFWIVAPRREHGTDPGRES